MRKVTTPLIAAALLLLAACGGGGESKPPDNAAATPSTTAAATTSPARPTTDPLELAVDICTDGMAEPDRLIHGAVYGARDGTRSVTEVADGFRDAQSAVEGLAAEAGVADLPRLSQALQGYANILGRARVTGDAGLTEITDAREAVNLACYLPDAPESSPA